MTKFTIVVPHYDGSISDEEFTTGINSLSSQTFKDFEVLIFHDGPLSRDLPEINVTDYKVIITKNRKNDWGHSLRDLGIKYAKGEYIIHFNPDNILYPNALETIFSKLSETDDNVPNNIVIFPVLMKGMCTNGKILWREKQNADKKKLIFTGFPPIRNNIDCMQLVMKKSLWVSNGGWYDKTEQSDGNMYPLLVQKYEARYCSEILGEHR